MKSIEIIATGSYLPKTEINNSYLAKKLNITEDYIYKRTGIQKRYYSKDENGISDKWMKIMKNSIISTGGKYSTSRMLVDYTNNLYMPLCNLTKKYYENIFNTRNDIRWDRYSNRNSYLPYISLVYKK